jgi:hypothetical protein
MWKNFKTWFVKSWIARMAKQLWSLVTDHNWDFDPWKTGAIIVYIIAVLKVNEVFQLVKDTKDVSIILPLSGLISVLLTVATVLMKQAKDHDATLVSPPKAG